MLAKPQNGVIMKQKHRNVLIEHMQRTAREGKMITGRLGYNDSNARYGLLVSDLWEVEGFHCGQHLEVLIDDQWVPTRMEMDWKKGRGYWYLVGTPYYGDLEYVKARYPER